VREQKFTLAALRDGLLDLLFPPRCFGCEIHLRPGAGKTLCTSCMEMVKIITAPICRRCGVKVLACKDRYCQGCLSSPPPFAMARSVAMYHEPVINLLHRLKYRGDTAVLQPLRQIISAPGASLLPPDCDLIVPVPLHRDRLRQRGLNQALLLARLGRGRGDTPIEPALLFRKVATPAQTGLSGAARRKNVRGAFAVKDTEVVRGRRICIVDDVFTTGATVSECARVLVRAGAGEVVVWTVARV
jgi:ComF family protein